ncbi:RAC-alpha serine/threonine-protein kinase [Balamuthia mandrillaris]
MEKKKPGLTRVPSHSGTILHELILSNNMKDLKRELKRLGKGKTAETLLLKDRRGKTPLFLAAELKSLDMLKQMHKKKGDVHEPDSNGWTPLHVACSNGDLPVVKFLLEVGEKEGHSDVDKKTVDFSTALHYYVRNKPELQDRPLYFELLAKLLGSDRANTSAPNKNGDTPLHVAAVHASEDVVLYLLNNDADVDKQNRFGEAALHLAAREGRLEVVKLLLEHGATYNLLGDNGTPREVAEDANHLHIANLLV